MHILFLTHYFPPEVNAPASRTYENCKRWVEAGHRVTVITCAPNHPSGILYSGYSNRICQRDCIDCINVLRVITYLSANKGFFKRTLNYISYMISTTILCLLVKKVDVVVSTSPQFFCGMAGFFVSRIKRCPWILEIRDLWPESIIAVGAMKQKQIISLLKKLETFLYRKADQIVCLTESFKRHIVKRGVNPEQISVITNAADLQTFRRLSKQNPIRKRLELNGKFVASYIGTHGMAHALETVLEAADLLSMEKNIVFMLVGDGAERNRLIKQKKALGLKNVLMLPQQHRDKMPEFLAASDACMVLLKKDNLFKTVIPSKMFEPMAMERPLILGVEGESKAIVEQGKCGLCIEPENHKQLAKAVLRLYNDRELAGRLGRNGRQYVEKNFDRDKLAKTYLGILEQIITSQGISLL